MKQRWADDAEGFFGVGVFTFHLMRWSRSYGMEDHVYRFGLPLTILRIRSCPLPSTNVESDYSYNSWI